MIQLPMASLPASLDQEGLSTLAPELSGKQLELLKEILPTLSRVAIVGNSKNPGNALVLEQLQGAADMLRMKLQSLDVANAKDIEPAFRAASKETAGAALMLGSPLVNVQRKQVIELAVKHRLPAMYYT